MSHESLPDPPPAWVTLSASAVRALPFGRYRAANFVGRFSRGPFRASLPADLGGYAFACDLRDSIAREVCFTGRYEPQETRLALAILRPGMTAVDAGANWGYFTLLSAHAVGPRGRVVALEPHPALSGLLALSSVRHVWAAVPLLFVTGFSGLVLVASCNTRLQLAAPDELRGRMMSLYTLVWGGVFPIGAFCVGAISEAWGVSTAFFVQGSAGLGGLAALALWWRRRHRARAAGQLD